MLLMIFGIALGLICLASAAGDLRKDPKVTESLYSIGVKESQLPVLAGLKVLGLPACCWVSGFRGLASWRRSACSCTSCLRLSRTYASATRLPSSGQPSD